MKLFDSIKPFQLWHLNMLTRVKRHEHDGREVVVSADFVSQQNLAFEPLFLPTLANLLHIAQTIARSKGVEEARDQKWSYSSIVTYFGLILHRLTRQLRKPILRVLPAMSNELANARRLYMRT